MLCVLDEAYAEYAAGDDEPEGPQLIREGAKVVTVDIIFMMNGVQLRRLNEESQPRRSFHIGVIEILSGAGKEVVPKRAEQRTSHQWIEDHRA